MMQIVEALDPALSAAERFQKLGMVGVLALVLIVSFIIIRMLWIRSEAANKGKEELYKEMIDQQKAQIEYWKTKKG